MSVLEREASVALDTHEGDGYGTLAMDAVNSTWVGAFGLRSLYRGLQGSDDSFEMTPDKLKAYGEGLPDDYLPLFSDAVSHDDALQIRRNALSLYESRERLANAGYTGVALQFGAAVLDPVNLATGAVAGTVGATAKASRLINMARVGLANVAAAAIPEAYLTAQDPERQNSDMLISMSAALALGGGVGAYQFSKLSRAAKLTEAATTPGVKLTEKGVNESFALASEAVTTGNRIIGVAADADGGTATNPSFWFNQQPATNPDFWMSPPAATNPGFWLDRAAPDAPPATNPKWSYHTPDTFPRWTYDTPDTNPSFWLERPPPAAEAEAVAAQGPKWSYVVPDTTPRWSYDLPDTNPEWSYRGDSAVTVDVERIADASEAAVKQAAAEVAAEAAAKGEPVVADAAGSPVPPTGTVTTTPSQGLGTAAASDPNVQTVSVAPPKNMRPGDLDFSSAVGKELPMPAMAKYRIGVFGKALGIANKSSLMNKMMAFVAEDVLPRAGLYGGDAPVPVIQSASEWRRFTASGIVSKFQKRFDAAFAETSPSLNPWKRAAQRKAFNEEVSIAARHMPGQYTSDANVNAAADAWRALKGESADYAQRYGVEGFDKFDVNAGDYFTRQGDHARIQQAIADYGLESVESVVAEAIRRRPKLDESALFPDAFAFTEEQIKLAARAWINMQGGYGEVSGLGRSLALSASPAERLAEAARTVPGITEDQIKSVVAMLESTTEAPRAKMRLAMDESTSIKPLAKYNPSARDELRFTDLLFNNVEAHARTYTNDTLGLASMKKLLEGMSTGPGDVIASPAVLLRRLDQDMIDAGVPILERKRAIAYAEGYLRHVQGLPIADKVSRANQAAQIATGLNYAVRGGSFVIANALELGGALTEAGVSGLFRAIPEMGSILRNAATGATDNPNVRFIADVLGVGNENWVHRVVGRMNYATSAAEDVSGGLEQGLRHVGRFSSKYTGLEAVNVFLKQTTAAAMLHNWAHIAEKGKLPSEWRLAAMGLTKADGDAITAQILKHAELNNGRVRDIHIDKWDPQTAARFIVAIRKTASRAVQENDIGQYAPIMTRPVAKLLTQFRSYAIAAYEKQLLFNLSARDSKAVGYFIAASMAGTLSYMGSVINNAAGRSDAKEYLKKRLAPDKIAMGAFSRAGYSSILTIPADYVLGGMGYDAPFSAGRTSGLDSDPLFGNPSFQMAVNARKLPSFARAAYDSKFKVSRDMFGAARTFVPLQGVPVIKQFLDRFQWSLPRESTPRR